MDSHDSIRARAEQQRDELKGMGLRPGDVNYTAPEAGEPLGRRATHGEFYKTAHAYEGVKSAIDRYVQKELPPQQRYALDMIAVKLSRIAAGDNYHEDHWRDIAGYASLVADRLERMPQGPEGHS